jgi:hypothetical protein
MPEDVDIMCLMSLAGNKNCNWGPAGSPQLHSSAPQITWRHFTHLQSVLIYLSIAPEGL